MLWLTVLHVLFAVAFGASVPTLAAKPTQLGTKEFKPENMNGYYVVRFSSPKCANCAASDPIWRDAHMALGDSGVTWAEVDCEKHQILCQRNGVSTVPQVHLYEQGKKITQTPSNSSSDLAALVKRAQVPADAIDVTSLSHTSHTSIASSRSQTVTPSGTASTSSASVNSAEPTAGLEAEVSEIELLTPETLVFEKMPDVWLIKYFSPYCPHCIDYAPKYEAALKELGGKSGTAKLGVHFAEVNCVEQADLCGAMGVGGFPVVMAYKDGELVDEMSGSRSTDEVVTFAEKQLQSQQLPVTWLNSPATYSKGKSVPIGKDEFDPMVITSVEPWLIKFYSPHCPHCQDMAPDWDRLALETTGRINVGEVNCLATPRLCVDLGVKAYPTIRYYKGETFDNFYAKHYSYDALENFAKSQAGANFLPVSTPFSLKNVVLKNREQGLDTYVYLYDEATAKEDWVSMIDFSNQLLETGGRLYRTDNAEIREKFAGPLRSGASVSFVDWSSKDAENPAWFAYPSSGFPEKLRDVDELIAWAHNMHFFNPVPLTVEEAKLASFYAPLNAILLTGDNIAQSSSAEFRKFRATANEFYESALAQQERDQEKMRNQRADLYKSAIAEQDLSSARKTIKTHVEAPFLPKLSFTYIDVDDWQTNFTKYVPTANQRPGSIVLVDFWNARYLDQVNGDSILDPHSLDAVINHFEEKGHPLVHRGNKKLRGKKPKKLQANFTVPSESFGNHVLVIILFILAILGILYIRKRRRSSGPLITGKLD